LGTDRNTKQKEPGLMISQYRQTGDLVFLGELYSGYTALVYGVCLKYLKEREDAKDMVMQVFEKLSKELLKDETNPENFHSWLYVVAKNECLMQIRKKSGMEKKVSEYSDHFFMENQDHLHPVDKDYDDYWEREKMEEALKDCIEKLRIEQKQCITLFYIDNKCYREISKELIMDENKVKSYIQNGKRNLKICMEENHGIT
jgi:RNA polymerase sigma-70 factor, ECF subfamily